MARKWYISPLTLEMTPGSEIPAQNLEKKIPAMHFNPDFRGIVYPDR